MARASDKLSAKNWNASLASGRRAEIMLENIGDSARIRELLAFHPQLPTLH
jgi:hypothetical protein